MSFEPRVGTPHSELSIEVSDVSKLYRIFNRPLDRLKQPLMARAEQLARWTGLALSAPQYAREFWALKEVSLQVRRGECFGILGRNGAGKSTLLQIIAGTVTATSGQIVTSGRVAALLELGSGFSPEFTGRENVWLSAALLGLSRQETEAKLPDIIEFAEVGAFFDQPLKTYSSGMVLRLAFAIYVALEPSILIVDEALAVGDARFQKRCYDRIHRFRKTGGTVVFVTHDMNLTVELCDRALILEKGRVYASGEAARMAREYHRLLFDAPKNATADIDKPRSAQFVDRLSATNGREVRYGSSDAVISELLIRDEHGVVADEFAPGSVVEVVITVLYRTEMDEKVAYGFILTNARGIEVYGTKSPLFGRYLPPGLAGSRFECRLKLPLLLVPGPYYLSAAIARALPDEGDVFLDFRFDALEFEVVGESRSFTTCIVDLRGEVSHEAVTSDARA